jgi:phosphomevalonate decarboxylase
LDRSTATAHPIQGILKYHGLKDPEQRIPFHDSISLCTKPTMTTTTVEIRPRPGNTLYLEAYINDQQVQNGSRAEQRISRVITEAMAQADMTGAKAVVTSRNNFPMYIGLGSSASGFAALALATSKVLGLSTKPRDVSQIARLGAGSATRGVTGGLSIWKTRSANAKVNSWAEQLVAPEALPWKIWAVAVPHPVPTEDAHDAIRNSPYFDARILDAETRLGAVVSAAGGRDVPSLMALAEQDTLSLHAAMLASPLDPCWLGITMDVIHLVRRLRRKGNLRCWFSIDTGAAVYVNCHPDDEDDVHDELVNALAPRKDSGAVLMPLAPAGPAKLSDKHLETPNTQT